MGIGTYRSFQFFLRQIWRATCDYRVIGSEHLIETGPLIIAANHASFFDPPLLGVTYQRPLSYMARESLFYNRRFSKFIREVFAFPLRRGDGAKEALRKFEERLQRDLAVVLFPEGTRSPDGKYKVSESAIGMLSTRNAAPVQPIYLMGTWHAWPRQQKYPRARPLRVYVAPAIHPRADLPRWERRAEQDRINREYQEALTQMQERAWAEYPAPPAPMLMNSAIQTTAAPSN